MTRTYHNQRSQINPRHSAAEKQHTYSHMTAPTQSKATISLFFSKKIAKLDKTRPPDKQAYQKVFVLISQPKHMLRVLKTCV